LIGAFIRDAHSGGTQGTIVPKRTLTSAITGIANDPQNVTRRAPSKIGVPPSWAANEPKAAKFGRDGVATKGTKSRDGDRLTLRSRTAAPTAKLAAEPSAP